MMKALTYGIHTTALGDIIVAQCCGKLCWVGFMVEADGRENGLTRLEKHYNGCCSLVRDDVATQGLAHQVMQAWENEDLESIPWDLHGTEFQKDVWKALLSIPRGEVRTYGDVAKQIHKPKASRAVGSAVGSNPISLLIPCHRVVQSSGKLGQYGWGVDLKKQLLDLESQNLKHAV